MIHACTLMEWQRKADVRRRARRISHLVDEEALENVNPEFNPFPKEVRTLTLVTKNRKAPKSPCQ